MFTVMYLASKNVLLSYFLLSDIIIKLLKKLMYSSVISELLGSVS